MTSFFGKIGHGIEHLGQQVGHAFSGAPDQPDPRRFNTGPQSPLPVAGTTTSGFTSAQQQQLQSALSAAGVWDTISNIGGDVWDVVKKVLPSSVKDADGNVDWGKLGGDIVGWIGSHKKDILDGLAVYSDYSRQKQADKYAQDALAAKKESYAKKEPLRVAGMAGMLDPKSKAPDISNLTARANAAPTLAPMPVAPSNVNGQNAQHLASSGSGNPFAQALPVAPARPAAPPMPTPGAPGMPMAPPPMTPRIPRPLPVAGGPGMPPGGGRLPMNFDPNNPNNPLPVAGY